MKFHKLLSLGDALYKKNSSYDAIKEWETVFSRELKSARQLTELRRLVIAIKTRIFWLLDDGKYHDAGELLKTLLNQTQRLQKQEKQQLYFLKMLFQELILEPSKLQRFYIINPFLQFSLKNFHSFERMFRNIKVNEKKDDKEDGRSFFHFCQDFYLAITTNFLPSRQFLNALRFLILQLTISEKDNNTLQCLNDVISKLDILPEKVEDDIKVIALLEVTYLLVLIDVESPYLRDCISKLKRIASRQEEIGKRQKMLEIRELLIQLVQSIRQQNHILYGKVNDRIKMVDSNKQSPLPILQRKIEQKYNLNSRNPFFPF